MRLLSFAFVALFASSVIYAQDSDSELAFVKEGKVWNCHDSNLYYYSYIIEGDTTYTRTGDSYKKVWLIDEHQFGDTERHYFGAVRQEGDYVYLLEKDTKREYMLYDFGIRKGGILTFPFEDDVFYLRFQNSGEQEINGITRRWTAFSPYYDSMGSSWRYTWTSKGVLEGIGTLTEPFRITGSSPGHSYCQLVSCYEDDIRIYGEEEDVLNDISGVKTEKQGKGKDKDGIYDLQGRRLPSVPAKGIYIKDGKAIVK